MEKLKNSKHGKLILIGGSVLLALIIAAVLFFTLRDPGYRTIQVYRLDGEAEVTRPDIGTMTPYVNMMLESGDRAQTMPEGWLYLHIDDDKYLLAEPETRFTIYATGTKKNSRTNLDLEIGALVNHIAEPLSAKSSYEVTTPNSTMAVRGTSFRVEVWFDDEGVSHTLLQVFEGIVEVHLLYPDGSLSEEGRLFYPGDAVTIWGDDITSDYDRDGEPDDIDYISLKIPTLEFLKLLAGDDEYDITIPDIDEIIRLKQTYFDVTFMVNGQVFGTQSVLFDNYASEPSLLPTLNGYWDFDFSTAIREATEVNWVSN